MATRDEILRFIIEASGTDDLDKLRDALEQLEDGAEGGVTALSDIVDEIDKLRSVGEAARQLESLASAQADAADTADRLGLRLKLLTQEEQSLAADLASRRAALEEAQAAQRKYLAGEERTAAVTKELAANVRAARDAVRESNAAWTESSRDLARTTREYESAAEAQARLARTADPLARALKDAGVSTSNLAEAQKELAGRSEAMTREAQAHAKALAEQATAADDVEKRTVKIVRAVADLEDAEAAAMRAAQDAADALRIQAAEAAKAESATSRATDALSESFSQVSADIAAYEEILQRGANSLQEITEQEQRLDRLMAAGAISAKEQAAALEQLTKNEAALAKEAGKAAKELDKQTSELGTLGKESDIASKAVGGLKTAITGLLAGLSVGAVAKTTSELLELAEVVERSQQQFARLYGSVEQGQSALDDLRELAVELGQSYDATREAAASLKTFGLDPLDGTLRALIDTNTAMGGNQQKLEGMILAVGQAWAKQKLQGEEALQLIERGVPVWDLLAKATGKTTVELQKMSSAGELGRDAIKLLVEQMGKANFGAAAEQAGSFAAQLRVLRDEVERLGAELGMGGLEGAADAIGAVTEKLRELAASPEFAQLKEQFGVAFEQGAAAAKELLQNLDLTAALEQLAQTARILTLIGQHMERVSKHAGTLQKITDALSPHNEMLAGIEWVLQKTGDAYDYVGEKIDRYRGKVEETTEKQEALNEALEGTAESAPDLMQTYGAIIRGVADAASEVVEVMEMANETVDTLTERGAEVFRKLQEAIRDGTDPAAVQALQQEFDELQERIRNAEASGYALTDAMMQMAGKANDLGAAFGELKIKTQAALVASAADAEKAFNAVVIAAKNGEAATEDVARAFEVYARRTMDAAKYSDEATRKQVEAQLKLKAAALGLTDVLGRLGLAGEEAGKSKGPADDAIPSLYGLGAAADDAADSLGRMGNSAENAGDQLDGLAAAAKGYGASLGEMSAEAAKAYESMNKWQDRTTSGGANFRREMNRLTQVIQEQRDAYRAEMEQLERNAAANDELAHYLDQVAQKYNYLSENQQRALAEARMRADQAAAANNAENASLDAGNAALRERNKLLEQQKQVTQVQEIKRTTEVNVNFTAKATNINFDPSDLTESHWRLIAQRVIDIIRRDQQ